MTSGSGDDAAAVDRLRRLTRPQLDALEAAGVPATVVLGDRIVAWTADVPRMLGREGAVDELPLGTGMAPDQVDRLLAAVADAQEGRTGTVTFDYGHRVGFVRESVSTTMPVRDEVGQVVGVLVVSSLDHDGARDRHHLEEQLADVYRLLDRIDAAVYRFEHGPVPRYAYVNARAEDVLDVTLGELLDDRSLPARRTHPDDVAKVAAARRDPANATWPVRLRWRDRSGEYNLIEVAEVEIRDDAGRIVASLGTARNLTELDNEAAVLRAALAREQEAVDELRSVDELRQTFLRAVSHELRTPLTAVHGYAETLRTHLDRLSRDQLGSLADRMLRNAERLRTLFDDLLDIDRMSRGTMAAELREADLVDVVLQALEVIEGKAGQVRADLHSAVANVDVAKMQRVIDNLVGNAIKHGGDAVTVWVRTGTEDDVARLIVEDDGPGIPSADRERLFEPFEQGIESARAHSPGTGLGLTLVRELTALQGGEVEIEDREDGGARFVLSFPAVPAATDSR